MPESNKNNNDEVLQMKNANHVDEINNFFDNFIKKGVVVREKEITSDFKIKLKALNTEELLVAESIIHAGNPNIDMDIIVKIRAASILSLSIISINGLEIEREDTSDKENKIRRRALYKQILRFSPKLIQDTYEFYIEVVQEQNKIYSAPEEVIEDTKNF